MHETQFANKSRLKKSLFAVFIIILSWLIPPTSTLWQALDVSCAKFFNALFVHSHIWQNFVLFSNSHAADWLFDIVILAVLILAFRRTRRIKLSTLFIAVVLVTSIHVSSFRFFSRRAVPVIMQYKRLSPSLTIENYARVKQIRPEAKTKDSSDHCFPGDHAMTCSLFALTMGILFNRRYGWMALFFSLPILLARAWVGAHWMSDILIGSATMSLLYLSLLFYTPLFDTIVNKINRARRTKQHVNITKDL